MIGYSNAFAISKTINLKKWMKDIDDSSYIGELSIPGTHDSGSYNIKNITTPFARCQNKSLEEQLNMGCRFLDIRLGYIGDKLIVHHGKISCKLDFNEVISTCVDFLKENPSETILMSIKKECEKNPVSLTFAQSFMQYTRESKSEDYWNFMTEIPQLSEVRGKIVLLRRFDCSDLEIPIGLAMNFENNKSFVSNITSKEYLYCEDNYNCRISQKKDYIQSHISIARKDTGCISQNKLFLTFTSGYYGIPLPRIYAQAINKWLINNLEIGTPFGILICDFIRPEIISRAIQSNLFDK